jgi:hypothetical protein
MEYHLAPTFSNDNGPAKHAKCLETLETHKYVQDKLASSVILDLESLDLHATSSQQNNWLSLHMILLLQLWKSRIPATAQQLLMKIWKKGMPSMSLFIDVGSNWQKSEFLATYPDTDDNDWRADAFVAANAPAYLHHNFGEVGLSFSQNILVQW